MYFLNWTKCLQWAAHVKNIDTLVSDFNFFHSLFRHESHSKRHPRMLHFRNCFKMLLLYLLFHGNNLFVYPQLIFLTTDLVECLLYIKCCGCKLKLQNTFVLMMMLKCICKWRHCAINDSIPSTTIIQWRPPRQVLAIKIVLKVRHELMILRLCDHCPPLF